MLRQAIPNSNPLIQRIVDDLFLEDRRKEQLDRRAATREAFCRPVEIRVQELSRTISGITSNLSALGIGIITSEEIPECTAKIEVFTERAVASPILSELRWCRPFGNGWFVSGWKFVQVARS